MHLVSVPMAFIKRKVHLSLPLKLLLKPNLFLRFAKRTLLDFPGQPELIEKHRRKKVERRNKCMLCLARQKQEIEFQRFKQVEECLKEEQALIFAEREEDNRKRLQEATLTELELKDNVLGAIQLSKPTAQSQCAFSLKLTNWVTNASIEVAHQLTPVQRSTVKSEAIRAHGGFQMNSSFTSTGLLPRLQSNLGEFLPNIAKVHPEYLTGNPSNVAIGISDLTVFRLWILFVIKLIRLSHF